MVAEVLRPHLAMGEIVILDRYADSTLAYQGYGHRNDIELIKKILQFATGGLTPDLTFLLDVDPQVGLSRRQKGGGEWNRLDAYDLEYHRRVRQGLPRNGKSGSKTVENRGCQPDTWYGTIRNSEIIIIIFILII